MAELSMPSSHISSYGAGYQDKSTALKIMFAETIDITWTYYLGNNGNSFLYGDQYLKLSRNIGGVDKNLIEYEPGAGPGLKYDFFDEEFGTKSQLLHEGQPSSAVGVSEEPVAGIYGDPIHYGVPKTYTLRVPGPTQSVELSDWWQEVARREAYSYLSLEFAFFQLDRKKIVSQILPKAGEPSWRNFWLAGMVFMPHKNRNLINVVWAEEPTY